MKAFVSLVIATVWFASALVIAEELEPNRRYTGPATLTVNELGVAFNLPEGWVGAMQDSYFVVGSHTEPGLIILGADRMTGSEAVSFLSSPQDLGDGYVLAPTGAPQQADNTFSVDCVITNGLQTLQGEVRAILGDHGIGVAIIAVAPEALAIKRTAASIEQSITFSRPVVPEPGELTGPWVQQLAGVKIVRFYHGSGYNEKEYYNFCPDGSFYRVFEAGGATPNVASGAFLDENGGKWSVSGPLTNGTVRLYYKNGDSNALRVAVQSGSLVVDGNRWLRDTANCE